MLPMLGVAPVPKVVVQAIGRNTRCRKSNVSGRDYPDGGFGRLHRHGASSHRVRTGPIVSVHVERIRTRRIVSRRQAVKRQRRRELEVQVGRRCDVLHQSLAARRSDGKSRELKHLISRGRRRNLVGKNLLGAVVKERVRALSRVPSPFTSMPADRLRARCDAHPLIKRARNAGLRRDRGDHGRRRWGVSSPFVDVLPVRIIIAKDMSVGLTTSAPAGFRI